MYTHIALPLGEDVPSVRSSPSFTPNCWRTVGLEHYTYNDKNMYVCNSSELYAHAHQRGVPKHLGHGEGWTAGEDKQYDLDIDIIS